MDNEPENPFDKLFGVAPEKGYDITGLDIEVIDSKEFKGLDFAWSARGVGFGHVTIAWGIGDEAKEKWPKQFGFHTDTEHMSREFVDAMLHAAVPKLAELIVSRSIDPK